MRRVLAIVLALAIYPARLAGAASVPSFQSALPLQAQLLSRAAIPANPTLEAVTYVASGDHVAVLVLQGDTYRLLWSRALPYPGKLVALPQAGVFGGTAKSTSGPAGIVFAYRVVGGQVVSAIKSHPHGIVEADEVARYGASNFEVSRSDTAHVGSVKYRLVTRFGWNGKQFASTGSIRRPDYPPGRLPAPRAVVKTAAGNTIVLRLAVAATEQQQETGLMNIKSLDPDSGMIFVWDQPVLESFWMENTYIPLTVAFLSPNGTIQEMQDMQPLTTTYHTPQLPYQYAIEANLGFFAANGIQTGDRLQLVLKPAQ